MSLVVWHDIECGGYAADLPLWRELAVDPVLDVGAGTGRVSLDLAAHGHAVVALDVEAELLAELERRNGGRGGVRTLVADAESFSAGERFGSILVPMQTLQLLRDRAAFFSCVKRHLVHGGVFAAAIADDLEPFEGPLVPPDQDGRFVSQPTAVRLLEKVVRLERLRDDGETQTVDVIELSRVSERGLHRELHAAGLEPQPSRLIAATSDHVGSTVVIARA